MVSTRSHSVLSGSALGQPAVDKGAPEVSSAPPSTRRTTRKAAPLEAIAEEAAGQQQREQPETHPRRSGRSRLGSAADEAGEGDTTLVAAAAGKGSGRARAPKTAAAKLSAGAAAAAAGGEGEEAEVAEAQTPAAQLKRARATQAPKTAPAKVAVAAAEAAEEDAPAGAASVGQPRKRSGRTAAKAAAGAAAAAAQPEVDPAHSPHQEQQEQQAAEEEGQSPPGQGGSAALAADAGLLDRLAQEMFAALGGAFGSEGEDGSEGSSSEEEDEQPEQQQQHGGDEGAPGQQQEEWSSSESDDEANEGQRAAHRAEQVPRHLRWQPDLTLPGMQQQQQDGVAARRAQHQAAAPLVTALGAGKPGELHVPAPDERLQQRLARKAAPDTAGKGWYDLPATQITEEVKRDLRLLRLRGTFDPKSFYKKDDVTKFPKYFQMGTVIEGPADFYSGRLTNKQRKRTLTEEVLADQELQHVRKRRYDKLQEERQVWSRKKSKRKTENPRLKKSQHRPKH